MKRGNIYKHWSEDEQAQGCKHPGKQQQSSRDLGGPQEGQHVAASRERVHERGGARSQRRLWCKVERGGERPGNEQDSQDNPGGRNAFAGFHRRGLHLRISKEIIDLTYDHKYRDTQHCVAWYATMDLNRVDLFVRVVEAGSLTRAGGEIGMTTSGVSRALARLEQDLGVRLLQRTTRKLSLTGAGRTYFDQVRGALALVNDAAMAASNMGEAPCGGIRVEAPPAMVPIVTPFVAEFLKRYPRIWIELSSSQGIVDLVEHGIDFAIRIGRLKDSSQVARRVGHMTTSLFASKEYVKRNSRPHIPADLAGHNCVLFRAQGGKDTWRLRDGDREVRVEVTGSMNVDEIPSLHQAVSAGVGIGAMSCLSSSRLKNLVRILPPYIAADLPVSIVSPSKRLEPARVVLLREFLLAKMKKLPWRG